MAWGLAVTRATTKVNIASLTVDGLKKLDDSGRCHSKCICGESGEDPRSAVSFPLGTARPDLPLLCASTASRNCGSCMYFENRILYIGALLAQVVEDGLLVL